MKKYLRNENFIDNYEKAYQLEKLKKQEKKLLKKIKRAEALSSFFRFMCVMRDGDTRRKYSEFNILGLISGSATIVAWWCMLIHPLFAIAGVGGLVATIYLNYCLPCHWEARGYKSIKKIRKLADVTDELNYVQAQICVLLNKKRTFRNYYRELLANPNIKTLKETEKELEQTILKRLGDVKEDKETYSYKPAESITTQPYNKSQRPTQDTTERKETSMLLQLNQRITQNLSKSSGFNSGSETGKFLTNDDLEKPNDNPFEV